MPKEMIWVAKGGRPRKNIINKTKLLKDAENMSVPQLMEKYKVSQATMYRYLREAKEESVKTDYTVETPELTLEQALSENAALKEQVRRMEKYIKALEKKIK